MNVVLDLKELECHVKVSFTHKGRLLSILYRLLLLPPGEIMFLSLGWTKFELPLRKIKVYYGLLNGLQNAVQIC